MAAYNHGINENGGRDAGYDTIQVRAAGICAACEVCRHSTGCRDVPFTSPLLASNTVTINAIATHDLRRGVIAQLLEAAAGAAMMP